MPQRQANDEWHAYMIDQVLCRDGDRWEMHFDGGWSGCPRGVVPRVGDMVEVMWRSKISHSAMRLNGVMIWREEGEE